MDTYYHKKQALIEAGINPDIIGCIMEYVSDDKKKWARNHFKICMVLIREYKWRKAIWGSLRNTVDSMFQLHQWYHYMYFTHEIRSNLLVKQFKRAVRLGTVERL